MTPEQTNSLLKERYGLDLDGQPKFRLVWSSNEFENRVGTYREHYGSIFLREVTGVRLVPKYPFCPDRWVLEKRVPVNNPELMVKLSYEPLWVFQDANGNYLDPVWKAIEIILYSYLNPTKRPPVDEAKAEEAELKKEKQFFRDYFGADDHHLLAEKLSMGEAIVVPRSYNG